MKDLLLQARAFLRTKISCRHLADRPRQKIATKKRAARAARLFFLIRPIKSLICGVVVAFIVVIC